MNALNTKMKSVKMNWASITFPLLQGTPIGADGTIQNDEDAIGLVMTTLTERPLLPNIDILVAGDIDESEIVYNSPTGLSNAAKNALSNIWIYGADGSNGRTYGGGGNSLKLLKIIFFDKGDDDTDVPPTYYSTGTYFYEEGMTWGDLCDNMNQVWGRLDGSWDCRFQRSWSGDPKSVLFYFPSSTWGDIYNDGENIWKGTNTADGVVVKENELIDPEQTYYVYHYNDPECLVADSKIAKTTKKSINAGDVKSGDVVVSLDPETLELTTAKIGRVRKDELPAAAMKAHRWFKYKFDDGTELHLTGRHRFWNVEKNKFEWIGHFEAGEHTYKIDGSTPAYVGCEVVEEEVEWNVFWCENHENYFVNGIMSGNIDSPVPNFKVKR